MNNQNAIQGLNSSPVPISIDEHEHKSLGPQHEAHGQHGQHDFQRQKEPMNNQMNLNNSMAAAMATRPTFHQMQVGCALLCLSDKYRMNDLKHHCEYALHQLLNLESCLHLLLASNRYNARRLRSVSLNYVSARFQTLSQSVKFQEFGDCNPSLLQEVLSNVTKEVQARPQKRLRLAMPNGGQQGNNSNNNSHK